MCDELNVFLCKLLDTKTEYDRSLSAEENLSRWKSAWNEMSGTLAKEHPKYAPFFYTRSIIDGVSRIFSDVCAHENEIILNTYGGELDDILDCTLKEQIGDYITYFVNKGIVPEERPPKVSEDKEEQPKRSQEPPLNFGSHMEKVMHRVRLGKEPIPPPVLMETQKEVSVGEKYCSSGGTIPSSKMRSGGFSRSGKKGRQMPKISAKKLFGGQTSMSNDFKVQKEPEIVEQPKPKEDPPEELVAKEEEGKSEESYKKLVVPIDVVMKRLFRQKIPLPDNTTGLVIGSGEYEEEMVSGECVKDENGKKCKDLLVHIVVAFDIFFKGEQVASVTLRYDSNQKEDSVVGTHLHICNIPNTKWAFVFDPVMTADNDSLFIKYKFEESTQKQEKMSQVMCHGGKCLLK